jgi:hypothetical protein
VIFLRQLSDQVAEFFGSFAGLKPVPDGFLESWLDDGEILTL